MHNEAAMTLLITQRSAINDAINGLDRYVEESRDWKVSVTTSKMTAVKASASAGGVDISTWDGTPEPE